MQPQQIVNKPIFIYPRIEKIEHIIEPNNILSVPITSPTTTYIFFNFITKNEVDNKVSFGMMRYLVRKNGTICEDKTRQLLNEENLNITFENNNITFTNPNNYRIIINYSMKNKLSV